MRKILKYVNVLGVLSWFGLLFIFLGFREYKFVNLICLSLGFIYLLSTMLYTTMLKEAGFTKMWFKTLEELQTLKEDAQNEWERAEDMAKIIGTHEAIKYAEYKTTEEEYKEIRRERYLKLKKEFEND